MLDLKFKPGWVLQLLEKYTCAHTQLKLGSFTQPNGRHAGRCRSKTSRQAEMSLPVAISHRL